MGPVGEVPAPELELNPSLAGGSLLGKRFAQPDVGIEVLVTKAGEGTLSIDGVALLLKDATAPVLRLIRAYAPDITAGDRGRAPLGVRSKPNNSRLAS
jgi:hypothetical protein